MSGLTGISVPFLLEQTASMFPRDIPDGARGQMGSVNVPARYLDLCSGSNGVFQCSRATSRPVLGVKWGASMFPRGISAGARGHIGRSNLPAPHENQSSFKFQDYDFLFIKTCMLSLVKRVG